MRQEFTVWERFAHRFVFKPAIKRHLVRIPVVRRVYNGWNRTHPFDVEEQVETSGYVSVDRLTSDESLRTNIIPYAASSPSVIRKAIGTLPDVRDYAFVDLGCGKGRALIVATEYAFSRIIGVELSPELCATARRNAESIAHRHPERASMSVVEGNVTDFDFPSGKLVVFMYHAFGPELLKQIMDKLELALERQLSHVFFVYYNPVHSSILDASPAFKRWFAGTLSLAPEEVGYAPDGADTVVVWQSRKGGVPGMHPRAERRIVTSRGNWRTELA
jgi:SAM-dependent methyltransferase